MRFFIFKKKVYSAEMEWDDSDFLTSMHSVSGLYNAVLSNQHRETRAMHRVLSSLVPFRLLMAIKREQSFLSKKMFPLSTYLKKSSSLFYDKKCIFYVIEECFYNFFSLGSCILIRLFSGEKR